MATELDLLKVQYIENQIIQYRNTLARYGINSLEFNTALGKLKEYIQQYGVAGRETPDEGKHKAAFDAFLKCIHKRPLDMDPIEKTLEHILKEIEWKIHHVLFRIKQQNGQESTPQAARPPARANSGFIGLFSSNVKRSRLKDLSDQMYSVHENQESMPEHNAHKNLSPARALLVRPKKLTPEEQRFVRQPDEAEDQYIARLCEYINKSIHPDHKEEEALEAGHTATIGAFLHFIKRHPSAMKEYISMRRSDYLIWIHNAAINEQFYTLSIECHNEPHVRIISISCRLRNVPMHWGIAKQFLEAESYAVKQIPLHARKFQRNSNSIDFIQTALNDFLDVGITASEFESKNSEATERFLERLDAQEYLTQNIMYNMNCLITSNPQIIRALKRFSLQAVEFVNDSHLIIVVYRGIDPSETDQIRRRRAAGINFKHANVHAGGLKEDHYDKMKANLLLNRILDWIAGNPVIFEKKYNENFRLFDEWIKQSAVIHVDTRAQTIFLMGTKLMEAALSHTRQSKSTRIQTNRNNIPYVRLNSDEYNRIWPPPPTPVVYDTASMTADQADVFPSATSISRSSIHSTRETPPRPLNRDGEALRTATPPYGHIEPYADQTRLHGESYLANSGEIRERIPPPAPGRRDTSLLFRWRDEHSNYGSFASATDREEIITESDHLRTGVRSDKGSHTIERRFHEPPPPPPPPPSTSRRRDTSPPRERVGGRPSSHLLYDSDAENARKVTMLRAEYDARFNRQSAEEGNLSHSNDGRVGVALSHGFTPLHPERVVSNRSDILSRPMHEPAERREQMHDDVPTTSGSRRSHSSQPVVIPVTLKTDERQQHAERDEMHEVKHTILGLEPEPRRRASSLDREDRAREPRRLTSSEQQYRRLGAESLGYFRSGDGGNDGIFEERIVNTMPQRRNVNPIESNHRPFELPPEQSSMELQLPMHPTIQHDSNAYDKIRAAAAAAAADLQRSEIRSKAPSPELTESIEQHLQPSTLLHSSSSSAYSRSDGLDHTSPSRLITHSPSLPPTQQNSLQQLQTHISTWLSESDTIINTQADEILQQIKGQYRNVDAHVTYTVSQFIDKTYQKIEQLRLPEEILNEIIKTANTHCQLMNSVGNFIQFNPHYYTTMENYNIMQIKGALMTLQIAHRWKQFQENASPLAWV